MILFSEKAMAKYFFFRDYCTPSNIGEDAKDDGFLECSLMGITSKDHINRIDDVVCVKQECTGATTEINQDALFEWVDNLWAKKGEDFNPKYTQRVWLHTHPGSSATPSGTDEECWKKNFADKDWAAMIIIGREKNTAKNHKYCRVKYSSMIGTHTSTCEMYFEYDGQYRSIDFVFDMQEAYENEIAIYKKHKVDAESYSISESLFGKYSELHPEWLQELKDNVSTPVRVHKTYFGGKSGIEIDKDIDDFMLKYDDRTNSSHFQKGGDKKKQHQSSHHGGTTNNKSNQKIGFYDQPYSGTINLSHLIAILIKNKKQCIADLTQVEKGKLAKFFDTAISRLYEADRALDKSYKELDVDAIIGLQEMYNKCVIDETKLEYNENISEEDLTKICVDWTITPRGLKSLAERFIAKKILAYKGKA